jgi:Cu/Zn superoxide dismutase
MQMRLRATITALTALATAGGAALAVADLGPTMPPGGQISLSRQTVQLRAMPQGSATFFRGPDGNLRIRFILSGLTPGSEHSVRLQNRECHATPGTTAETVGVLHANAHGQSIDAGQPIALFPRRRVLTVMEGVPQKVMDGGINPLAAEILACVTVPRRLGSMPTTRLLQPVSEPGTATAITGSQQNAGTAMNHPLDMPSGGRVTYRYLGNDMVRIRIHAFGFKPGAHAAHIHQGTCARQGAVVGTLGDVIAGPDGQINVHNATVRLMPASPTQPLNLGQLYVNIHQGNGNHILDGDNMPTLQFRPLACANISLVRHLGMSGKGIAPVAPPLQPPAAHGTHS